VRCSLCVSVWPLLVSLDQLMFPAALAQPLVVTSVDVLTPWYYWYYWCYWFYCLL